MRKEELPDIDEMLQQVLVSPDSEVTQCPHCQGYVSIDLDGDLTCLNCARPAVPRRGLDDVVENIAQKLVDSRAEIPGKDGATPAPRRALPPRQSR